MSALQSDVPVRHPEREDMNRKTYLTVVERRHYEPPDLIDHRIGHGIAAGRGAAAMHNEKRSGAAMRLVEGVWESQD
jgi:hypothetical protein